MALAALLLALLLGRRDSRPTPREPSKTDPRAPSTSHELPSRPAGASFLEQAKGAAHRLREALANGGRDGVLAAARALRDLLLAEPSLVAEIGGLLADPSAPADFRRALAVVLGSLSDGTGKRVVLEALRGGSLAGLERTALLALGIEELDDGESFERDNQPYAMELAPGLVVFVHGRIADAEARAEATRWIAAGDTQERLAAARLLRETLDVPEVRWALFDRLEKESDAEVTSELAAALCGWTRSAKPEDAERTRVLDRLFATVPRDEQVRFRLTAPLSSAPLSPAEVERLRSLASAETPEVRRFAVDVLGRRLDARRPEGDPAVGLLARAATSDPSPGVREMAALMLGRAAQDPRAVQSLLTALRDSDWEVRATAARSLGRASGAEVRSALEAATSDDRAEVRAAASKSLSTVK
jgi:HEAT repeat protein